MPSFNLTEQPQGNKKTWKNKTYYICARRFRWPGYSGTCPGFRPVARELWTEMHPTMLQPPVTSTTNKLKWWCL